MKWTHTVVIALVCGCPLVATAEFGPELQMLPENTRYLMYRGLPMQGVFILSAHGARYPDSGVPGGNGLRAQMYNLDLKATYGNYSTALYWHWPEAKTWKEVWDKYINNAGFWSGIRSDMQSAASKDFVFHLMTWHARINYSNWTGNYSKTDLFYAPTDPRMKEDLGKYGLPGKTRTDVHLKLIENIVKYTWDLPNAAYCFAFEACNFVGQDGKSLSESKAFQKWWADQLRAKGAESNSEISHLISSFQGGYVDVCHPSCYGGDFYLADDWHDGFHYDPAKTPTKVWEYKVPMMREAAAPADDPFPSWSADKKYDLLRKQFAHAYGTGDFYGSKLPKEMSNWFLQVRWYIENLQTFENEPGDEVTEARLPKPTESARPSLVSSSGFTDGSRSNGNSVDFSVVYKDADGDAPAITEVWVDRNGDGRFDPTPGDGERFIMKQAGGTSYSAGVTYTVSGIRASFDGTRPLAYVFRFADKNWYPPAAGGVVPTNNEGIGYRHWEIVVAGGASTAVANSIVPAASGNPPAVQYDLQGRVIPREPGRLPETNGRVHISVTRDGNLSLNGPR